MKCKKDYFDCCIKNNIKSKKELLDVFNKVIRNENNKYVIDYKQLKDDFKAKLFFFRVKLEIYLSNKQINIAFSDRKKVRENIVKELNLINEPGSMFNELNKGKDDNTNYEECKDKNGNIINEEILDDDTKIDSELFVDTKDIDIKENEELNIKQKLINLGNKMSKLKEDAKQLTLQAINDVKKKVQSNTYNISDVQYQMEIIAEKR